MWLSDKCTQLFHMVSDMHLKASRSLSQFLQPRNWGLAELYYQSGLRTPRCWMGWSCCPHCPHSPSPAPPLRLRGFTGNTSQVFCQVSELNHLDEQAHEHQGRHRRKMRASSGSNEVLAQLNHKITLSPSVSVLGFNHLCKHTALLCLQLAAGFAITSQSACPEVFWVVGKCKLRARRLAHKEF